MKTNETIEMLIKVYAEYNFLTENQVKEEIRKGWISGNELFADWLKYEGIFGYENLIIKIFQDCEKAELKITE